MHAAAPAVAPRAQINQTVESFIFAATFEEAMKVSLYTQLTRKFLETYCQQQLS